MEMNTAVISATHALASLMSDWDAAAKRTKQTLLSIADRLVDTDPRVAPAQPPGHVRDEAAYHWRRAKVLKDLLVEATVAYFLKTGEPMTCLPVPPPYTADDL